MNSAHPYWLVVVSLVLALSPIVIGLFTSFVKVHVVLSFFRSGLGAQQVPSGLVILGLSIALSLSIMNPTLESFQENLSEFPIESLKSSPEQISVEQVEKLVAPWRSFLIEHAGKREILVFKKITAETKQQKDQTPELKKHGIQAGPVLSLQSAVSSAPDGGGAKQERIIVPHAAGANIEDSLPWSVLLPAFVVTELKEAFIIGFVILLPFLAIDLIVANLLAGVGMFMVSPVMISLPLKVALFTFADGWLLLTKGLAESYIFGAA